MFLFGRNLRCVHGLSNEVCDCRHPGAIARCVLPLVIIIISRRRRRSVGRKRQCQQGDLLAAEECSYGGAGFGLRLSDTCRQLSTPAFHHVSISLLRYNTSFIQRHGWLTSAQKKSISFYQKCLAAAVVALYAPQIMARYHVGR